MSPFFALVLLAFVHNEAAYIEYQDSEDDQSDDADFDDQYESEDIITAPTRTTSEDPISHSRIRRYGQQNLGARTLSLDEIRDVRGAIKELLANHQLNLMTTYNTETTTDYTSPEYEVLTKDFKFTGTMTKTRLEDLTNFYDDVIGRIIDSAKRQGFLMESTTQFQTQPITDDVQTMKSSAGIFVVSNPKIEVKSKRKSDVPFQSLNEGTKSLPQTVQYKKIEAISHNSRTLPDAIQDFDGMHYEIPEWIQNIPQLTQIIPERTRGRLITLKSLFPLDENWGDKNFIQKVDGKKDREVAIIGKKNGRRKGNIKEEFEGKQTALGVSVTTETETVEPLRIKPGGGETGVGETGGVDTGGGETGGDNTGAGNAGAGNAGAGETDGVENGGGDTGGGDTGSELTGAEVTGAEVTGAEVTGGGDADGRDTGVEDAAKVETGGKEKESGIDDGSGEGDNQEESFDDEAMFTRVTVTTTTTTTTTKKLEVPHYYPYPYASQVIPNTTTSNATTIWRTKRLRTTTKPTTTTAMPPFDIPGLIAIVADLTNNFESNITDMFNKTLQRYNIPTCPSDETTETPIYYDLVNATVVSKCFVCGMTETEIPRDSYCSDAFSIDFIPLVPMDPQSRGRIVRFRKYCRYLDVRHSTIFCKSAQYDLHCYLETGDNFYENATEPRSVFGRFTGGCSVRWIDISSVYTQRACRNRRHATTGRHFGSKRMAKLEMALHDVDNGCIISPMATLTPLSRGISLYARFHACVCTGSWCNVAAKIQPWIAYITMLIFWSISILVNVSVGGDF